MTANILIPRHDKIGDFVVSVPMFKVLKQQRPELILYALVSKVNFDLASNIDFIDHVILYDPDNLQQTLSEIKRAKIDTSISAFIDTKLAWLLYRASIKQRIAPATKIAQYFFNQRLTQRRSRVEKREFEYNLDLLTAFDSQLTLEYSQPLLSFSKSASETVICEFREQHQLRSSDKIVAFHPGSGGSAQGNLNIDDYLSLAKSIVDLAAIKIVFTFGPDDQNLRQQLSEKLDFAAILYNSSGSLTSFCLLLSHFQLFVSTSTGTMHLAAASNTATLSFFGEDSVSSPQRWASVSSSEQQHNIVLPCPYSRDQYRSIEAQLLAILSRPEGQ
ncbi:MAG: hypothetical protein OFPI_03480 [Osedax symbiont Rs2]|nr:MAG: hypothetical protein OFPI_03480 [Osedax symbiont Rs2]